MAMIRALLASFHLAWKKESNWANTWVYIPFALARPLAGALLIWVMVRAAGKTAGYFAPAFLGNALFQIVPAVLAGISFTVMEDRERYQMFKYIYLSPTSVLTYLVGHGLARFVLAGIGVAGLVAAGYFLLGLRVDPGAFRPGLFALALALGLTSCVCLGIALAGVSLLMARHGNFATESIGGVFFLLSGAVFPVDVLPFWLRPLSYASPVTYWLELSRRACGLPFGSALASLSDRALTASLAGLTALSAAGGIALYRACIRRAKWKGLLDATTGY